MIMWRFLFWCALLVIITEAVTPLKSRVTVGETPSDEVSYSDLEVELGNSSQNDESCDSYATCSAKGNNYWNKLYATIISNIPDRTDGKDIFLKDYSADFEGGLDAPEDLWQQLADRGMGHENLELWYTTSKNPETGRDSEALAYMNVVDTANGVIIAMGNWRDSDQQKSLQWSELMYQTWQLAQVEADKLAKLDKPHRPGKPISNLQSVVQHTIVNQGTLEVLEAAYKAAGYPIGQGDTTWQRWTETDTQFFFFGLLGTDNCKGTVWLLNDHSAEIGKKMVSVIWTRWTGLSPDIWYVP
ncbi:MAG: hypothetical protein Q9208_005301 [Pyrenodesmia sp. 3 TL-2023]